MEPGTEAASCNIYLDQRETWSSLGINLWEPENSTAAIRLHILILRSLRTTWSRNTRAWLALRWRRRLGYRYALLDGRNRKRALSYSCLPGIRAVRIDKSTVCLCRPTNLMPSFSVSLVVFVYDWPNFRWEASALAPDIMIINRRNKSQVDFIRFYGRERWLRD